VRLVALEKMNLSQDRKARLDAVKTELDALMRLVQE
jgi:hypothetical protein